MRIYTPHQKQMIIIIFFLSNICFVCVKVTHPNHMFLLTVFKQVIPESIVSEIN